MPTAAWHQQLGDVDRPMMERCLELAMRAACRVGEIVCESINTMRRSHHITHHTELLAISRAFHKLGRVSLEDCTIYSNAEPCAYCCYAMRESRIGRVVYGIPAPLTGGVSPWNILADTGLSTRLPEVFAPPPKIVSGFMSQEIETAIARQLPLAYAVIRVRKIFGGPLPSDVLLATQTRLNQTIMDRVRSFLRRHFFDYFGRK
jgi:tRNA(adenine34) deaminase